MPAWLENQLKKGKKGASKVSKEDMVKKLSPYLEVKKSNKVLLSHATTTNNILSRFKKQPTSGVIGAQRYKPAEKFKEYSPVRKRL